MAFDNSYESKIINIKNTRFIFKTNFRGEMDPNSKYPSSDRVANIVVPEDMVASLEDAGISVKATHARPGEEEGFVPTYHIKAKVAYRDKYGELKPEKKLPKIKLYPGINTDPVLLTEDTIGMLDEIDIQSVSVSLNPWENPNGVSLYIRNMSVLQDIDDDPFADLYGRKEPVTPSEEEPF